MMHSNQSAELWKAFIEQVFLEASDTQIRRAASRFQEPRMHEQAMRHLTGMGRASTAWNLYVEAACARLYQAEPALWLGQLEAATMYAQERPEMFVESVGQAWTAAQPELIADLYRGVSHDGIANVVAKAMNSIGPRTFAVVPTQWVGSPLSDVRVAAYERGFEDWMLPAMVARDVRLGVSKFPHLRYPMCLLALYPKSVQPQKVPVRGLKKDDLAMAEVLRSALHRNWDFTQRPPLTAPKEWPSLVETMRSVDGWNVLQTMLVRENLTLTEPEMLPLSDAIDKSILLA